MTQKKRTIIKQGAVGDVMSQLSKLPTKEKDPDAPITLPEIFRAKEYALEINSALKRGYSFADIADIFTERCGVKITARQLKYHCTHERNLRAKSRKSQCIDATKSSVSPINTPQMSTEGEKSDASHVVATTPPATGDFPIDRHRQPD